MCIKYFAKVFYIPGALSFAAKVCLIFGFKEFASFFVLCSLRVASELSLKLKTDGYIK